MPGLLTIGIPTYNGSASLRGLFKSVKELGLNSSEYEILLVDNNSDDDTDVVVEQLQIQYPNLRYHKNTTNIGRIENWNKVIDLTRGDYLIIMNVNDRFVKFDLKTSIQYLDQHSYIPMVYTDIDTANYVYPNWVGDGIVNLKTYIKKTFLDPRYLEFNSLGVLHQHIFRTKIITANKIRFDSTIPRTTDRVFTAQVVAAGGGSFYYTPQVMVSWHLNKNRYHYSVHNNTNFNFDELWANEYKANLQVTQITGINYKEFLQGQLIFASFYQHVKQVRYIKSALLKMDVNAEMEVATIDTYYAYLKTMARLNNTVINYIFIKYMAYKRMAYWVLKSTRFYKNKRWLPK